MKKQGKVKAIPVKEVTEGMQVVRNNNIGKIIGLPHYNKFTEEHLVDVKWKSGILSPVNDITLLKTLVVEYEDVWFTTGKPKGGFSKGIKQLPLKYSQWQSAIDNGEVNSDKVVEFEIMDFKGWDFLKQENHPDQFAKIIPQNKRMYTEDDFNTFALWLDNNWRRGKKGWYHVGDFYHNHIPVSTKHLVSKWFEQNVK